MIELTIKFEPETGEINVDGPWEDGITFLGMLEMAKCSFFEAHSRGSTKTRMEERIVVPPLLSGLKKPS